VPGVPHPVLLGPPGPVRRVTLNRPEARNAVSSELRSALVRVLGEAAADPTCRAVVLAGAGPDFCAGADLAGLEGAPPRGAMAKPFDPAVHEAVATEEGSTQNVVVEVYQTGYKHGQGLLRPAVVKVGDKREYQA